MDLHSFLERGRDVLADVVGPDRQLAGAPIDEHREVDRPRPATPGPGPGADTEKPAGRLAAGRKGPSSSLVLSGLTDPFQGRPIIAAAARRSTLPPRRSCCSPLASHPPMTAVCYSRGAPC